MSMLLTWTCEQSQPSAANSGQVVTLLTNVATTVDGMPFCEGTLFGAGQGNQKNANFMVETSRIVFRRLQWSSLGGPTTTSETGPSSR